MSNQTDYKLPKWPFFLGDATLIILAFIFYLKLPTGPWGAGLVLACCAVAAGFGAAPFFVEYKAMVRLVEAATVVSATEQIKNLESIATQIAAATAQWQAVQEHSGKTAGTAKEIADKITAEAGAFQDFLQKANDNEKANLRLEVEKLRRGESDWLQVVVRILDHIYALHQAALRSRQPGLIEQLGHFQNACRDVARRIGLVPFAPAPGEPFDPRAHQAAETQEQPSADATVGETVATGYTFQGQLVRPALIRLQADHTPVAPPEEEPVVLTPDAEPVEMAVDHNGPSESSQDNLI
jgi:molecular chaperone GrpE (heat shock protein)